MIFDDDSINAAAHAIGLDFVSALVIAVVLVIFLAALFAW